MIYTCPTCPAELISALALQRHRANIHDDLRCLDCHQHHATLADAFACDDRLRAPAPSAWNALREALGYEPVDWHDHAACRAPGVDPAWFWPQRGDNVRPARDVCAVCPVIDQCRTETLDVDPGALSWTKFGIRAGMSERERRRARRAAS